MPQLFAFFVWRPFKKPLQVMRVPVKSAGAERVNLCDRLSCIGYQKQIKASRWDQSQEAAIDRRRSILKDNLKRSKERTAEILAELSELEAPLLVVDHDPTL